MCNSTDSVSRVARPNESLTDQGLSKFAAFIGDLIVAASVSQLSLPLSGTVYHETALKIMFCNFAAGKNSQLTPLKEINLSSISPSVDNAYKRYIV